MLCAAPAAGARALRGPANSTAGGDWQSLREKVVASKAFQDKVADSCNKEKAADKKADCETSTQNKLFCMLLQRSKQEEAFKEAQCQSSQGSFAAVKAKIVQSSEFQKQAAGIASALGNCEGVKKV